MRLRARPRRRCFRAVLDDDDPFPSRRRHVDVVHADSGATHHPQAAARLEDRLRHPGLAAHNKRIEVRNALDELCLLELADDRDLAGSTQPLEAVLGERVGDQDPGQVD